MALRRKHRGYQISITQSKGKYCYELTGKGKFNDQARCGFASEEAALAAGKNRISGRKKRSF